MLLKDGAYCCVIEFLSSDLFKGRLLTQRESLRDYLFPDLSGSILHTTRDIDSLNFYIFSDAVTKSDRSVIVRNVDDIAKRCIRLDNIYPLEKGYFLLIPLLEEIEHE